MRNLGTSLIGELGLRGQCGRYFNFAGYRALRCVETVAELADFLDQHGYGAMEVSKDVIQMADELHAITHARRATRMRWACAESAAALVIGPLALPLAIVARWWHERQAGATRQNPFAQRPLEK